MKNSWSLVALGDILTQSNEITELELIKTYRRVTVKMWGEGAVLRDEVEGGQISAKKQNVIRTNQFILSRIDARHGATAIVPKTLDGAIVSNDFPSFELDHSRILPGYLGWLSKTRNFIELCKAASEGTTNRVRLKLNRFRKMKIPLPPLDEQRRIVARIEELAAKVERAQSLRRQAAAAIDSLMTSLHFKLAGKEIVTLDKFLTLDEQREKIEIGKEYPQIGIRGFGQGLFPKEAIDATQTSYKWFNRLYEGAIVLSQPKGWEGAIAVCPPRLAGYYASPEYRTFRCIEGKATPEYLAEILATPWFWKQLRDVQRGLGGRRQRTRPEQFLSMEIPMPTLDQQKQAVQIFKKLMPIKRHQAATVAKLEALLPSILDRAFRGEL